MEDMFIVSRDPIWHRFIDVVVILLIGFAAWLVLAQALSLDNTVQSERVRQINSPSVSEPGVGTGSYTDIPSNFRVEEG